MNKLKKILLKNDLQRDDITFLLSLRDDNSLDLLKKTSQKVLKENCSEDIYLRGLVEFSNQCYFDCFYCGIRQSNFDLKRYRLREDEILHAAKYAAAQGFGSLVLQSGQNSSKESINFLVKVIKRIKQVTKSEKLPEGLGITLSVGEQSYNAYKKLFAAGAHRYLLRIETSSKELFKLLHPHYQNFDRRIECLMNLKSIGYQVGTGVMIGLPGQTLENLSKDIRFFKEFDFDMLGMGPYVEHKKTPLSGISDYNAAEQLQLALNMIAVARIVLKDVNIASTTALEALSENGKSLGLDYGANVLMPMLTPEEFRSNYKLYEGKPGIDSFLSQCSVCENGRTFNGRNIGLNVWGDSKHFHNRNI